MFGNFNQVQIKPFGEVVDIPDDNVAKLMYYLSCVDTVINYNEIDKLSDYENYDLLTVDDMAQLFRLVLLFNPEEFIKARIFILDQRLLPPGMGNQFYQITDERIGMVVNNEFLIGGRAVKVLKVMACNLNWLKKYYFTPWKNILELTNQYKSYSQPSFIYTPPPPKPIYTPPKSIYNPPKLTYHPPSANNNFRNIKKRPNTVIIKENNKKDKISCSCLIF